MSVYLCSVCEIHVEIARVCIDFTHADRLNMYLTSVSFPDCKWIHLIF